MVGRVVGDRLAEGGRLGQVDIGGQVDLGVGEPSRQRPLPGDLRFALLGVGRHHGGAGVSRRSVLVGEPGVHGGEELFHGGDHGGIVDALLGAEDDRSRRASGAEIGEVAAEDVEAVGTLGVGDLGRRVVGGTDRGGSTEDDDEGGEPDADRRLAVVEAPGSDAGEEADPLGRMEMRFGSSVGGSRVRRCPSRVGPWWRAGCVSVERRRNWTQLEHNQLSDGAQPPGRTLGRWKRRRSKPNGARQRCRFGCSVGSRPPRKRVTRSMSVRRSARRCSPCSHCRPARPCRSRASCDWCGARRLRGRPTRRCSRT